MTKARPAAAAKQVQVDTAAYERIVELAETAHCTMAHAASLLVCVADFDAAVERHCSEVMQTAAARGSGKPAAAPAASAAARPRDASGQPAAASRAASAAPPRAGQAQARPHGSSAA